MGMFKGSIALVSTALLAACAQQAPMAGRQAQRVDSGGQTNTESFAQCVEPLTLTSVSNLAEFMNLILGDLEGPVTWCLDVAGAGTDVPANIRIEAEDDQGYNVFETTDDNLFYSNVRQANGTITMEIIWMDDYGFVQLKGTTPDTQMMTATIKYHVFPSADDLVQAEADALAEACRTGGMYQGVQMNVARCMGYNWPNQFWWQQPVPQSPAQQMLTMAQTILNDTTKTKVLGTITFRPVDVIR